MASAPSRLTLLVLLVLSCGVMSCSEGRKRPPGFLKVANICELADTAGLELLDGTGPRIILRHDGDGYSAMSTQCTFDLSDLHRVGEGSAARLRSRFNDSEYTLEGVPTHGPAVAPLPYYELELSSAVYGGSANTLYVRIGAEVPRGWRLKVDRRAVCAESEPAAAP